MRSDKNKKTDPNREIDDFLSKFDDASDTESEAFNSYLDEDHDSSSSKQNFKWKEVEPVKSTNKKHKNDKAERKITKDPAPSSIKVERNKDDSDKVHTYPVEDIIEPSSNKPEAVEPEKADAPREDRNTVSSKPKKVGRKKKKAIAKAQAKLKKKEEEEAKLSASAEDILHQSFGDSVDPAEELDAMFSDSEKTEDSEIKAGNIQTAYFPISPKVAVLWGNYEDLKKRSNRVVEVDMESVIDFNRTFLNGNAGRYKYVFADCKEALEACIE